MPVDPAGCECFAQQQLFQRILFSGFSYAASRRLTRSILLEFRSGLLITAVIANVMTAKQRALISFRLSLVGITDRKACLLTSISSISLRSMQDLNRPMLRAKR
jgi:hypothetical protein